MDDIESLCERILILREGRLVYDGSRQRWSRASPATSGSPCAAQRTHPRRRGAPEAADGRRRARRIATDDGTVALEVPRERATRAASALMECLDVADLAIEEEPLANIIERLQRAQQD